MSDGLVCDACGATLLADSDVRYVLEIRGYAAYDPMELGPGALAADHRGEMERLIRAMESMDPTELEDDIHKEFRVDLCPRCWKVYRRDPLSGLRRIPGAENKEKSQGN
jgi:hypothetical protein